MSRRTFTPTVFYSDLSNTETGLVVNLGAVQQAVFNLLNTTPGERIFEPEIGVQLEDLLFEPNDPVFQAYAMAILNDLARQEPRVSLEDVEVELDPEYYEAGVRMKVVVKRVRWGEEDAEVLPPIG